jgi:hypothetical protein
MEAVKNAGLIIDYKVVRATPRTPDQPNIMLMITFQDGAAALDKGVEQEEVAKKVIGSTEFQNKAREVLFPVFPVSSSLFGLHKSP